MTIPFIGWEAEEALDWLDLCDAITEGHLLPRAKLDDSLLRRGDDALLSRTAWIDGLGALVKTATVFPDNAAKNLPTIGGGVSLFNDRTGILTAWMDFALLTKWKTAADSLLAARRLANPDSRVILIIGAGTVAQSLRQAYAAGFPGAEFWVWARDTQKGDQFAKANACTPVTNLQEAVTKADIVTCATMARTPILKGDWLRPGQHIDLIGAYRPDMREADDRALERSHIFVDSRDTTLGHIGEIDLAIKSGAITAQDIVGDYYDTQVWIRSPQPSITLFKNGGGAHLDLMTARYILDALS